MATWQRSDPLSRLCSFNPFFFLLLNSFCHRNAADQAETFGASKRAEMANIEQNKKIVPLITREITFGKDVCDLVFDVDVTDLDFGVHPNPVKQSIQSNSVETCPIVGRVPLIIILITASLSS